MRERVFRFKQFAVRHERAAMKLGTDGVLLGAWAEVASARRVLDVGTGCGVIALMVAQRNRQAIIDAIDIDVDGVEESSQNFAASSWADRLRAVVADVNDYAPAERYDHIVSNPPYFDNGVLPPEVARRDARHTTTLTYDNLLYNARRLLTTGGMLSIITPADAHGSVVAAAAFHSMRIVRLTQVVPVAGHPAKRLLWQLVAGCNGGDIATDTLVIESEPGVFTDEYRRLTADFYLKF